MRVALDYLFLANRGGGIERYGRELPSELLALRDDLELTVVVSKTAPDRGEFAWGGDVDWLRLGVDNHGRRQALAQFAGLPARGVLKRWDLIHSVANVGPPRVPGMPTVVTVHDLIWHHAGEDWGPPEAVSAMRRNALRAARWATRIQADSRATRDDLVEVGAISPDKIDVVPLGVAVARDPARTPAAQLRERFDLGKGPVILSVAQKRPYKNLVALVRLAAGLPSRVRVVLPGAPTPYEDELRALAAELGVGDRVRFPGWVSDEDLEGLYALAKCVVVPSRFEGFGLPVLEAMARGVPVACADAMSLPEVAGDAALIFDAGDQAELDTAVSRLLTDRRLRRDLATRGRERAARFTWRATAESVLASYERTLAR